MSALRLIIFDVDGTLVDSQPHILASMTRAFAAIGRSAPPREAILSIVGLSLPVAMTRLHPDGPEDVPTLVEAYKACFADARRTGAASAQSPLYPGARECLAALSSDPWTLLGVATGKSRRGLAHLLELHGLEVFFQTTQVADDHPSKPHPSMVLACLSETGIDPMHTTMIGDTTYDVEMGRSAGVRTIGVSWGYHPAEALRDAGADLVVTKFDALRSALVEGLQAP